MQQEGNGDEARAQSGNVDERQRVYRDLTLGSVYLPDREQVALELEQLADRGVRVVGVAFDDHRLEALDAVTGAVEDVEVGVDDRVEDGVEEKAGRLEVALRKRPSRSWSAASDPSCTVTIALCFNEDRRLAAHDLVTVGFLERVGDDEVVVLALVDLRPLALMLRVLDRERVEPELARGERHRLAIRIGDVEPAGVDVSELGDPRRRALDDAAVLPDKQTCGNRCAG